MLDDNEEKNLCIMRLKAAFAAGFHGDSEEVLNGSANAIIDSHLDKTKGEVAKTDSSSPKKRKGQEPVMKGPMDKHFNKKRKPAK